MHVASQQLSEELFKLTKLDPKRFYHTKYGVLYITQLPSNISGSEDVVCPAYTLSDLLRKLPPCELRTFSATSSWAKWYDPYSKLGSIKQQADSPEDAACKLAIALAKANLIPIEEGKTDEQLVKQRRGRIPKGR